jgi:predicted HD phosphohydrolase
MADDLKTVPAQHDEHEPLGRATFSAFTNATPEDWQKIVAANSVFSKGHVDRIVTHLNLLKGDCGGFPIDRLEHSLQTATLAHKAGWTRSMSSARCCTTSATRWACSTTRYRAAILKPFVSEKNLWMVENHGIFQGYYFWHHIGLDRTCARIASRPSEAFEYTAQFCHLYDQNAFDAPMRTCRSTPSCR